LAVFLFEGDHALVEVHRRPKLRGLLSERLNQVFGQNLRESGDVEDVLLGVKRRELAAKLRQRIDDLRAHAPHASIKPCEKTGRPAADDRDIDWFV